jgi:hypothetical protein
VSVRVYVPSTVARLRTLLSTGTLGPAPLAAHAVTDAVRRELSDAGEEEWEYAASTAAAQASVGLLGREEPARRVVLAVDVPEAHSGDAEDPEDPTRVLVRSDAPLRWVGAVLADAAEAEAAVAAARDAALSGAPDAERLLLRCLDHDLGWWAVQELDVLVNRNLGPAPEV